MNLLGLQQKYLGKTEEDGIFRLPGLEFTKNFLSSTQPSMKIFLLINDGIAIDLYEHDK